MGFVYEKITLKYVGDTVPYNLTYSIVKEAENPAYKLVRIYGTSPNNSQNLIEKLKNVKYLPTSWIPLHIYGIKGVYKKLIHYHTRYANNTKIYYKKIPYALLLNPSTFVFFTGEFEKTGDEYYYHLNRLRGKIFIKDFFESNKEADYYFEYSDKVVNTNSVDKNEFNDLQQQDLSNINDEHNVLIFNNINMLGVSSGEVRGTATYNFVPYSLEKEISRFFLLPASETAKIEISMRFYTGTRRTYNFLTVCGNETHSDRSPCSYPEATNYLKNAFKVNKLYFHNDTLQYSVSTYFLKSFSDSNIRLYGYTRDRFEDCVGVSESDCPHSYLLRRVAVYSLEVNQEVQDLSLKDFYHFVFNYILNLNSFYLNPLEFSFEYLRIYPKESESIQQIGDPENVSGISELSNKVEKISEENRMIFNINIVPKGWTPHFEKPINIPILVINKQKGASASPIRINKQFSALYHLKLNINPIYEPYPVKYIPTIHIIEKRKFTFTVNVETVNRPVYFYAPTIAIVRGEIKKFIIPWTLLIRSSIQKMDLDPGFVFNYGIETKHYIFKIHIKNIKPLKKYIISRILKFNIEVKNIDSFVELVK